jgi:hypothetical protein
METPRRRAVVKGREVEFFSRNTKTKTVKFIQRWPSFWYRSNADAEAAKEAWEQKGKIMFPGDFGKTKATKAAKPRVHVRIRTAESQHELRV